MKPELRIVKTPWGAGITQLTPSAIYVIYLGMKWALPVLIISTFALNAFPALAQSNPILLPKFCAEQTSRALEPALQDLFDRYPDTESRSKNPQGFVADIDKVIRRMPYAEILSCRDKVPYQLTFLPVEDGASSMFVNAKYSRAGEMTSVTLNFNLAKSTPGVFFSYLHELKHVCQKYDTQELVKYQYQEYAKLTPIEKYYYSTREDAKIKGTPNAEFQKVYDDVRRLNFLNEIEAFHTQFLRFRQTTETNSPGLCNSTNLWMYIAMEKDLLMGHFAQNIMSSYMNGVKDDDPAFFISNSPLVTYYDQGAKNQYQMRELNSAMVQAITQMGIRYLHPHEETGRLR